MKIIQKIVVLIVFILVVLAFLEVIPTAPKYKDENKWIMTDELLVGLTTTDSTIYPENTKYAFDQWSSSSNDLIKVQLRLTADDQLITSRDASIERLTGVNVTIRDKSYSELLDYNYAVNFVNSDGLKEYENLDSGSPLIAEMVPVTLKYLFETYPEKQFLLEMMDEDSDTYKHALTAMNQLIETYKMKDQVILSANTSSVHDYIATRTNSDMAMSQKETSTLLNLNLLYVDFFYTPKQAVLILPYNAPLDSEMLAYMDKLPKILKNQLVKYNEDEDVYYSNFINEGIIKDAHRHNVAIIITGVNEQETMKSFIEMGVDGIITNRVDRLDAIMDTMN